MADQPQKLLSTTDAMTWASEFCRIFDGGTVVAGDLREAQYRSATSPFVDQGTMVTWFANAMGVAEREGAQAHCPHTARFDITEDLECCRKCGKVFGEDDD